MQNIVESCTMASSAGMDFASFLFIKRHLEAVNLLEEKIKRTSKNYENNVQTFVTEKRIMHRDMEILKIQDSRNFLLDFFVSFALAVILPILLHFITKFVALQFCKCLPQPTKVVRKRSKNKKRNKFSNHEDSPDSDSGDQNNYMFMKIAFSIYFAILVVSLIGSFFNSETLIDWIRWPEILDEDKESIVTRLDDKLSIATHNAQNHYEAGVDKVSEFERKLKISSTMWSQDDPNLSTQAKMSLTRKEESTRRSVQNLYSNLAMFQCCVMEMVFRELSMLSVLIYFILASALLSRFIINNQFPEIALRSLLLVMFSVCYTFLIMLVFTFILIPALQIFAHRESNILAYHLYSLALS